MASDDPHNGCKQQLAEVLALVRHLQDELRELKAKSGQNSSNSNKPPSSDAPFKKPSTERPKAPGKRPKGAQRGHTLHERHLVELDLTRDKQFEFKPTCSCGCTRFDDVELVERFQRFELPERPVEVTEFRRYRATCRGCDTQVEAPFPDWVGGTYAYGNRLVALIGLAASDFKLSKRDLQSLVQDVLGAPISVGSIVDQQQTVSRALEASYGAIERTAQQAAVANVDETSWFFKGTLWWLWVMSTPQAVLFKIQPRRNTEAAQQLLGQFDGLLGSDRFGAYESYSLEQRQLCWAHLIRDFLKWQLFGSKAAERLLDQAEWLFMGWWRYRDGHTTWALFQSWAALVRARMEEALDAVEAEGLVSVTERVRQLQKVWTAAWTFAEQEGVEPTNNEAERMLRKAVLLRKISYGTQSEKGNQFTERILSFSATVRRLKRAVFSELGLAVTALRAGASYCLQLA